MTQFQFLIPPMHVILHETPLPIYIITIVVKIFYLLIVMQYRSPCFDDLYLQS